MKSWKKLIGFGTAGFFGFCLVSSAAFAMGSDPSGSAPAATNQSKSEQKAVAAANPGVNVKGESGNFNEYVNDNLFPTDEEIRLMDVDPDSRVVLGGDDDATGVSFKKSYSKSPIAE
jgi:hypothetical protein